MGFVGRFVVVGAFCFMGAVMAEPETVVDEDCNCSFTLDGGMRHGALDDEAGFAQFTAGNLVRELYLMDEVLPKSGMVQVPVSHVADSILHPDDVEILEPRTTVTIGALPGVMTEYTRTVDDVTVYEVMVVLESPTAFHVITAWTLLERRRRNEDLLHSVIASFQALDEAESDPWGYPLFESTPQETREGIVAASVPRPWGEPTVAQKPPGRDFRRIWFDAPLGRNVAYLSRAPRGGGRHPAVLWAHGGFGGIGPSSSQSLSPFLESGIVLMIPSWRAENENPGEFEQFYGEVDDLLAARDHLASLPYVDPKRIYLAGHSTGGTLTLLAAASTDQFRAAVSVGGAPSMVDVQYGDEPYASDDRKQIALRSAILFTGSIRQPTFYFEGADSPSYLDDARAMHAIASSRDIPFEAWVVPGHDHFTLRRPLVAGLAQMIASDDDLSKPFEVTDQDVEQWFAPTEDG